MIEDPDTGFRITLDDEQRLRAKARLCWFLKHGNTELPADWNEEQLRQFIRDYDEECRAWLKPSMRPRNLLNHSSLSMSPLLRAGPAQDVLCTSPPTTSRTYTRTRRTQLHASSHYCAHQA